MKQFETDTIQAIVTHFLNEYDIALEPLCNKEGNIVPDHFKCDIHKEDFYFVCMIEPNIICMDSSKGEFMMAIDAPNEIKSQEELIEILDEELKYYL